MSQLQHPPSCFSLIHPANSGAINCWGDGSVCCLLSQRRVSSARLPLCYTTLYFYWVHVFVNRNTTGLRSPNSVSIIGQFLMSLHALRAFFFVISLSIVQRRVACCTTVLENNILFIGFSQKNEIWSSRLSAFLFVSSQDIEIYTLCDNRNISRYRFIHALTAELHFRSG